MPLWDRLRQHSRNRPDACAVAIDGRALSYRDLARRAARLDAYVAALPRGPRPQAPLRDVPVFALLMGNHPMVAECLVAALAGQSCVMLLDPLLPAAQLRATLEKLPPDVLFIAGQWAETFHGMGFPVVPLDTPADLDALSDTDPAPAEPKDSDPFLIAFTSGTTSRPKAFLRNRRGWRVSLGAGRAHFGTHPNLHTLSPGPLTHGLSLYALAETLDAGACFHAMGRFSASTAWDLMADHRLARLVCVPSVIDALYIAAPDRAPLDSLRQVTTAGAKLDDRLLAELSRIAPRANVTEYYGASELGFVTTASHRPDEPRIAGGRAGVGHPFPGVEIDIRAPLESGEGTIWVRSAQTIDGYLWQDGATAFRRDRDWATVGDIGRIDGNGALRIIGRADGMVISGGNNIYPEEVATCLRHHPAITEAAVIGLPDPSLGQAVVAVLGLDAQKPAPTVAELTTHCGAHMQKYKVPRRFLITQEWPMTASGKIATGQLAQWIEKEDARLVPL
ncbi:class I adenylate-forming enzyme family protein [Thalassococcus sp. BH17M4-6]|uniref:class I adenylate-forming enzyme family protein n=1 Tax=Thalassococcus sp. BH17M4-6 TaxID=3413148 RepID=UPI003BBFCF63